MRILVLSDTHGELSRVYEVYEKLIQDGPLDYILHCGDFQKDATAIHHRLNVPVLSVPGNCDGNFDEKSFEYLETECGTLLLTHGHMERVSYSMQNLYYKACEHQCIGAIFGHTHRSVFTQVDDIYLMNPGSLSRPRDGSGGTFGLLVTGQSGVWGKIYSYEDYICLAPMTAPPKENPNAPDGKKSTPKVKGGHLRELLNYSDRF